MKKVTLLFIVGNSFIIDLAFADNLSNNQQNNTYNNTYSNYKVVSHESESQIEKIYSGVVGTGIKHNTVTAAGGAVEFSPSGSTFYAFFTQTLSNGIYYEGRLYTKDNYNAQNPIFTSVPVSNENNPWGYGAVVKIGYDFHPNELIDIIPYLRLNAYNNMSVVYQDTNGDNINSTTFAVLPGVKVAYKVTPQFNPYVELFGGWQQVNLSGDFPQSSTPGSSTATTTQYALTYEVGFSSKLTSNLALIPYFQYITTQNNPDSTAAAPYNQNGFNISALTSTQQVFGLKMAASW